jgi:predicted DNA-binding protein (UPF0251 family)
MTRPKKTRLVGELPEVRYFKPAGVPMRNLEEVTITHDEFEALRLVCAEGLYQEQAAESMGISRQTLGRILSEAQRKVAVALLEGMAIRIEGADYAMPSLEPQNRCRHGRFRRMRGNTDE